MSGSGTSDFAGFYRSTLAPLRHYLARIVGSREDAQDLAQDAYVRVYAAMNAQEVERPQALLYVTARNLALNRLKRRRLEPEGGSSAEAVSDAPDARRLAAARQDWAWLERAIQELPPGCRAVLLLRKIERLSHKQIAARLGISRSTSEKQLVRALRLLRASYPSDALPGSSPEAAEVRGLAAGA